MEYEEFDKIEENDMKNKSKFDKKSESLISFLTIGPSPLNRFHKGYPNDANSVLPAVIDDLIEKRIVELKDSPRGTIIGLTKEYREKNNIKTGI